MWNISNTRQNWIFGVFVGLRVDGNWNTTKAQRARKSYLITVEPFCILDTDVNRSFRYSVLKLSI